MVGPASAHTMMHASISGVQDRLLIAARNVPDGISR
ncbi:Hypothetical protein BMEA_B0407 [Brucella melitensis ATCC 23457]|uniref:Uncharacterized protein n=2 Tax=Brucella melitensis TaxID=29459 RepID=C0RKX3_BRUMB|nr:Hypothetical protein BMEA_B0407 [Brucella melitensis ATCC 23457]